MYLYRFNVRLDMNHPLCGVMIYAENFQCHWPMGATSEKNTFSNQNLYKYIHMKASYNFAIMHAGIISLLE